MTVELDIGADGSVAVAVVNDEAALPVGDHAGTGGGYGLEGLAEQVRLVGGTLSAGPASGGWVVEARSRERARRAVVRRSGPTGRGGR